MPKTTIGPILGYTIHITVVRDDAPVEVKPAAPDLLDELLAYDRELGAPPHLVTRR